MLLSTIDNVKFKGVTKYLSCDSAGRYKRISECPFGTTYFGETKGLTDLIKRFSYPYANIEETIGKLHENRTNKVYYADPNEIVRDSIKLTHDYIVHDVEPSFPNIIEDYFGEGRKEVNKRFKELINYYARLQSTELKQNKPMYKSTKQILTEMCVKIYGESSELRKTEDALYATIQNNTKEIQKIEQIIPRYENELNKKRISLSKHQNNLAIEEDKLNKWKYKRNSLKENPNRTKNEVETIKQNIKSLTESVENIKCKITANNIKINSLENHLTEAYKKIIEYKDEIENSKNMLEQTKKALLPNYEKLCKIYKQYGIKFTK